MPLRVMSWNTLDAFSEASRQQLVLDEVYRVTPDVAFFSEAYREGQTELLADTKKDLLGSGYDVIEGLYHDEDGRKDRHGFMALYHESLGSVDASVIRMAGRNAVHMRIWSDHGQRATTLIGVHLDDRRERTRAAQARSLITRIQHLQSPRIIAGDLNAMHQTDAIARKLRMARAIAPLLPVVNPGETAGTAVFQKIGRAGSVVTRLTQMANGGTLALLESNGLRDVDPLHQPTMPARNPRFQLDHVMVSAHFGPESNLQVLPESPASDHRAIVAELTL